MTFFHFINCLALTYAPFFITYKYSGLAEYSSVWKCAQASLGYFMTQMLKLLTLATFFPSAEHEGETFDLLPEFMKSTVDLMDWAGLYLLIFWSMAGKGEVKFLAAGLGWAGAECLATRLIPFWVGARGIGFDWKYIQMGLESNLSLVHFMSFAALVWLWKRVDLGWEMRQASLLLLLYATYRGLIFLILGHMGGLGGWALLLVKLVFTSAVGGSTLVIYASLQSRREMNNHYAR